MILQTADNWRGRNLHISDKKVAAAKYGLSLEVRADWDERLLRRSSLLDTSLWLRRNPEQLKDLVVRYGDQVRTVALDVTNEQAAITAVSVAVEAFGRLDVVANNAGYGEV